MKIKISNILLLLAVSFKLLAAIPEGYYDNADAKNANNLRQALKTIISANYKSISYDNLWTAYATTDINSSTGKLWDVYSNCSFTVSTNQCGTYQNECDCYNREHTTPRSWFGGAVAPMNSDLFNVYPTDGKVNGVRDNFPYGEVGAASYTSGNGSKLGNSDFSGYSGVVFEPVDEYKGDLARTVMYMAVRYADNLASWLSAYSGETDVDVVYDATSSLTPYAMNLFLSWSRMDPVSAKETARNEAVYGIQSNRNPFIDFPGLEEYIWGNKTGELFYLNAPPPPTNAPVITATGKVVNNGQTVAFGTVSGSIQKSFTIRTSGISGDLTVAASGAGYSVSTATILQAQAESGYNITITFNPPSSGNYTGNVSISGGGLAPAFVLNLTGSKL
ncbi:hypothetical protein SDC9_103757 [bioreactor metagenome]|uniref:Uncharacterized protein n=1 Tax=bioreactor metagenome TaxID=1076179 RepID=A0A645AUX6_9ZZZZ